MGIQRKCNYQGEYNGKSNVNEVTHIQMGIRYKWKYNGNTNIKDNANESQISREYKGNIT